MKTFLTILSSVILCSVFFTPSDGAPLSTYVIWFIGVVGALFVVNIAWKELKKWEEQ